MELDTSHGRGEKAVARTLFCMHSVASKASKPSRYFYPQARLQILFNPIFIHIVLDNNKLSPSCTRPLL